MDLAVDSVRSLVWAHHPPDQHERCIVVDGRLVCRRCSVLYPLASLVLGLSFSGLWWPADWDRVLLFSLPVPAVVELVLEHAGLIRYARRRQVALTVIAAPALGRGLWRYLDDHRDHMFWTMVLLFAGIGAVSSVVASVRETRATERTRVANEEAHPLLQGFESEAAFRAYLDGSGDTRLGGNAAVSDIASAEQDLPIA